MPSSSTSKAERVQTPAPFAQPMKKLLDKRKKIKDADYGIEMMDDEMDDFIVDDEEDNFIVDDEEEDRRSGYRGGRREDEYGYDRDEIWSMFNRGKRRSDYVDDYEDLSDMEATGADVLMEEQRSARRAREEDDEEERELKKHAMEKAKRKKSRQD